MFYRKIVGDAFDEAVAFHKTAPSDLKIALKNHPAIPKALDLLSADFQKVADQRIAEGKRTPDTKHIKSIVADMVMIYIHKIDQEANRRIETDSKRLIREMKEKQQRDLDASVMGELSGDYADVAKEAGLIQVDERDVT